MSISEAMQNKFVELYQDGYSTMQISQKLEISDSIVRYYLQKQKIKKRSISEAITNLYITKFNKKPFQLSNDFSKFENELKLAGIMLYWGEGAKTGGSVQFTNSDPEMIKIFLKFLRKICGISENRLKILIHMYPDQNEGNLKFFWAKIANVQPNQFYKSYVHKGKTGTYKNKSQHGTLAINYSDKKLLQLLLSWIEEYKNKLR